MKASQLAINSISTRHSGLEAAVEAYAAAGFSNVEFHLPLVRDYLDHGHTVADVRALLAANGMRAIGGFQLAVCCFGDEAAVAANHETVVDCAALIHDLGGGTLVVGTDGPAVPTVDALAELAAGFRQLLPRIEGLDVTVALEFNWSPLVKSLQSAVRVCELVDHPQLGVLFDPAHYYTTVTKFEDLTERNVRWIRHVHLDDMADKPGELSNCNSDRVLPGSGVLDLHALIARIEQFGYDGYFSIEMFSDDLWAMPASEAARLCRESLARYLD